MKQILLSLGIIFSASISHAACFVEYKAKQDDPLNLHYGIMQIDAGCEDSFEIATRRLLDAGWTLLNIISSSDKAPTPKQKEDAGENYLRY